MVSEDFRKLIGCTMWGFWGFKRRSQVPGNFRQVSAYFKCFHWIFRGLQKDWRGLGRNRSYYESQMSLDEFLCASRHFSLFHGASGKFQKGNRRVSVGLRVFQEVACGLKRTRSFKGF